MIKTEYKINLQIDDDNFNISVREPNFKEKKELELRADKQKKALEELSDKQNLKSELEYKLKENERLIAINTELIKDVNIIEKTKLLLENKALVKEGSKLNAEILTIKVLDFSVVENEFETLLDYKNELLISGDDKEKLLSTLKDKGIKNSYFWEILGREIAKELEKK